MPKYRVTWRGTDLSTRDMEVDVDQIENAPVATPVFVDFTKQSEIVLRLRADQLQRVELVTESSP